MVNPTNPNFEGVTKDVTAAALAMGVHIDVVRASSSSEIEVAFATLARSRADALVIGADPFLTSRRLQLATWAARHAIPAVYNTREFPEAGGLIELRNERDRDLSTARRVFRPYPQGRQA